MTDPVKKLLAVEDYAEFIAMLRTYANVDAEALKREWKAMRAAPAPAPKKTTTNRSMAAAPKKKVIVETAVETEE